MPRRPRTLKSRTYLAVPVQIGSSLGGGKVVTTVETRDGGYAMVRLSWTEKLKVVTLRDLKK